MTTTEKLVPGTTIEEGEEKEVVVDPRVFVCSFPKSGTHLVEQIIQPLVYPMPAEKPWVGTFRGNSWTLNRIDPMKTARRIGYIRDGTYAKGHVGYTENIETFLYGVGAAVLFAYRDPRDVAVSLAHHILDGKSHPHNEWYQEIGFDASLLAVIQGLGPYASVLERWNAYAGWLDVPWVMPLKFSDVIADKERYCSEIVRYIVGHCAGHRGYEATLPQEAHDQAVELMVANSERTERSPTFRKGQSGGWRDEFKKAHVVAFMESDEKWSREYGLENSWLVELGFEDDGNWGESIMNDGDGDDGEVQ